MNFFIFFILIFIKIINCDVIVYVQSTNQIIEEFRDLPARFGPSLPRNGLKVLAVNAVPHDACAEINPPPKRPSSEFEEVVKWAVVIARFNCSFEDKVRRAQLAGYDAAIVHNVGSNELETMSAKDDQSIIIPSIFVGETSGRIILTDYVYTTNNIYALVLNDDLPFNINTHLILPFSIVVGLCFIIMIGFMIVKCVREQRRLRRYRLPSGVLKKIPTIKFLKGHPYETCVICLDDYVEGDKLRVLPCAHAYHCKCIDPWLTKNRRVCPICKRKVFVRGERRQRQRQQQRQQTPPQQRQERRRSSDDSTSNSDSDDTTPLLNPVEHSTNHGTFSQQSREAIDNVANLGRTDGTRSGQQRRNPFDRTEYIEDNSRSSNWERLMSLFRRRTLERQYFLDADRRVLQNSEQTVTASPTSVAVNLSSSSSITAPTTSNNVLNSNLSGSFNNCDEDDEYYEPNVSIYEPIRLIDEASSSRQHQPQQQQQQLQQQQQQQKKSRIGVAAIPNTNFQLSGNTRRNDNFSNVGDSSRIIINSNSNNSNINNNNRDNRHGSNNNRNNRNNNTRRNYNQSDNFIV